MLSFLYFLCANTYVPSQFKSYFHYEAMFMITTQNDYRTKQKNKKFCLSYFVLLVQSITNFVIAQILFYHVVS